MTWRILPPSQSTILHLPCNFGTPPLLSLPTLTPRQLPPIPCLAHQLLLTRCLALSLLVRHSVYWLPLYLHPASQALSCACVRLKRRISLGMYNHSYIPHLSRTTHLHHQALATSLLPCVHVRRTNLRLRPWAIRSRLFALHPVVLLRCANSLQITQSAANTWRL
jgi:hypothetical protein